MNELVKKYGEKLEEFKEAIKELKFEELASVLNMKTTFEIRGIVLDEMEHKDGNKFLEFLSAYGK